MEMIHFTINSGLLRAYGLGNSPPVGPVPFNLAGHRVSEVESYTKMVAEGIRWWQRLRHPSEEAGKILFSALMECDKVRKLYRDALAKVRYHSSVLHLGLSFDRADFSQLPWEFLFDPEEKIFLSASDHISITRLPEEAWGDVFQTWRPPLRFLVVLPMPSLTSWPGLKGRQEPLSLDTLSVARIFERSRQQEGKELVSCRILAGREATPSILQAELRRKEDPDRDDNYDVLYFIGHSHTTKEGTFLLLEDGTAMRRGAWLSVSELGQSLKVSRIRVVILSSCDSFAGAMELWSLRQFEAVVGMKMEMPMITASAFDEALINGLTAWQPIDRCVLEGRLQAKEVLRWRVFDDANWDITHRPDWAIPVLFVRSFAHRSDFCSVQPGLYQLGLEKDTLTDLGKQLGFPEGLPTLLHKGVRSFKPVSLDAYQISRWPVTNHQYRHYLQQVKRSALPPGFERLDESIHLVGLRPHTPVVNVTRKEAEKFCRWLGGRLPTADEWEAAARGVGGMIFPWGKSFDPARCSAVDNATTGPESVFNHANGASQFGVEDMCGNVFEWVTGGEKNDRRGVVVGGSWKSDPIHTIPSARAIRNPNARYPDVGFRCVIAARTSNETNP